MSKKVKIFCGPNNYDFRKLYFEEANEYIVGVDSGLAYLVDHQIKIDLAIGDFDSIDAKYLDEIKNRSVHMIELDKEKNMTDLAFTIDYIYNNMAYDEVEVFGGIGGRIDHLLANLNLLKRYDISLKDNSHFMFVLKKGKHKIENFHRYISFFAIEDCYNLSLKGFKFDLDNYYLSTNDSLCVSNEGSGEIEFSKGRLLVISSDDFIK